MTNHLPSFSKENIDLVYLWCDGTDPQFIQRKQQRLKEVNPQYSESNIGDVRYVQYDELKYSLRSVELYAPWIRHIFIVTNKQKPIWLKDHPKVTIVDHTEIIPHRLLPVFSSVCIELFLDKIPGLSEHFLYANDDMFFNRPVYPEDFFTEEGNPIVYVTKGFLKSPDIKNALKNKNDTSWGITVIRAWDTYFQKHNHEIPYIVPSHSIDAYKKSLFKLILNTYPELYQNNTSPFRTGKEISRILFSYEMIHSFHCPYIFNPRGNFWARLRHHLIPVQMYTVVRQDLQKMIRDIRIFQPKTFCINDMTQKNAQACVKYLQSRFPNKTTWEY